MKVLVLGGPGFLGAAACKELMRRGWETVAASRTAHPYGTFTSHLAFDRRDPGALRGALEQARPDVLLDLACFHPADLRATLETFRGVRYVFVSTGVYSGLSGAPAREEDFAPLQGQLPEGPLSTEDGKRWCETLLTREPWFPSTVVRVPPVLGAGDPSLRIAAYFQRVEDGGGVLLPAESFRRPAGLAWVRDVGFGLALACDPTRGETGRSYNIAFEGVSLEGLVTGIGQLLRRPARIVPVPFASLPQGASPYGPDPSGPAGYAVERAKAELGFAPSPLAEALAETMAWYRVTRPSHPGYQARDQELSMVARAGPVSDPDVV